MRFFTTLLVSAMAVAAAGQVSAPVAHADIPPSVGSGAEIAFEPEATALVAPPLESTHSVTVVDAVHDYLKATHCLPELCEEAALSSQKIPVFRELIILCNINEQLSAVEELRQTAIITEGMASMMKRALGAYRQSVIWRYSLITHNLSVPTNANATNLHNLDALYKLYSEIDTELHLAPSKS